MRGLALALVFLVACEQEEPRFEVVYAEPPHGAIVPPDAQVALGFSMPVERATCHPDTLHLVALGPDDRVAWRVPHQLVAVDGVEDRYLLKHQGLMPGVPHAVVVQGGDRGCRSLRGHPVVPFTTRFEVATSAGP